MSRVFISYSRRDAEQVGILADDLRSLDHEVWLDRQLSGGQSWWDEILAGIRQCDVFVVALSQTALDSRPCQLEREYAAQLRKTFLPVLVAGEVSTNLLPSELSSIQFIDYRNQDRQSALALTRALSRLPPGAPLPEPLPPPPPIPLSRLGELKAMIETPEQMPYEEQSVLLMRLKGLLKDPQEAQGARELLARMAQRQDVYAQISSEINAALGAASPPPPPHASATAGVAHSMPRGSSAARAGGPSGSEMGRLGRRLAAGALGAFGILMIFLSVVDAAVGGIEEGGVLIGALLMGVAYGLWPRRS